LWVAAVVLVSRLAADAWIASTARQWSVPLVTTDFRDYAAIDDLDVVPIR
jgi:predicted nucleic acid-binding protein